MIGFFSIIQIEIDSRQQRMRRLKKLDEIVSNLGFRQTIHERIGEGCAVIPYS